MVIGDRKNRTDRVKSLRIGDVCKDPPRLAASKGTKLMKLCGGRQGSSDGNGIPAAQHTENLHFRCQSSTGSLIA